MRVLLVEDQPLIGKAVKKGLTEEAFAVDWVTSVVDAAHLGREVEYDAVILDLMLPDGSGFEVLGELKKRASPPPVLILTAKDSIQDKLTGFQAGTDDYLTKPFVFEELLSRVRALTRRKYQFFGSVLRVGRIELDTIARVAKSDGQALPLTSRELAVLELFMLRRGHVLSREKIAEHLYDETVEQESNVIDVFVNKLRRKLETAGERALIETIRGEGYVIR